MNYETKYLKYKMKYLELKAGGIFGSKPIPTPLTNHPDRSIDSSEEINIDGINMKVDKIKYKDSPSNYQEWGMDFPLYTIIVLSFSNKPDKKNYVPYFELTVIDSKKDLIKISKEKIHLDFFAKLTPDVLKTFDEVVEKYSKVIFKDFKPQIDKSIEFFLKRIERSEEEIRLKSRDIIELREDAKEKKKNDITIIINQQIDGINQQIDGINQQIDKMNQQIINLNLEIKKLEDSKINEIEKANRYIDSVEFIDFNKRTIEGIKEYLAENKSKKEKLESYLI